MDINFGLEVVAKIINQKSYVYEEFVKMELSKPPSQHTMAKTSRSYTFDITKAEEIFDFLMVDKMFKYSFGQKFSSLTELKDKEYCKYHNSCNHSTNNCIVFQNDIEDQIDKGKFIFSKNVSQAWEWITILFL